MSHCTAIGGQPRTPVAIIYLPLNGLFSGSFPIKKCPYLYLGCSLVGFTSFHSKYFYSDSVTVALSRYSFPIRRRRNFPCRKFLRTPLTYGFVKHEHYKHLSLCEHGLSSAWLNQAAITRVFKCFGFNEVRNVIIDVLIHYNKSPNLCHMENPGESIGIFVSENSLF